MRLTIVVVFEFGTPSLRMGVQVTSSPVIDVCYCILIKHFAKLYIPQEFFKRHLVIMKQRESYSKEKYTSYHIQNNIVNCMTFANALQTQRIFQMLITQHTYQALLEIDIEYSISCVSSIAKICFLIKLLHFEFASHFNISNCWACVYYGQTSLFPKVNVYRNSPKPSNAEICIHKTLSTT